MSKTIKPKYPVYIPSKGRAEICHTARFLVKDETPFNLVVEPQEYEAYASVYGDNRVLVLPFKDRGSVVPARNWIWEHAISTGAKRHWTIDDNTYGFERLKKGRRIRCDSNVALRVVEDFTDRYENIAIAGHNYHMFAIDKMPPFYLNVHIYSCNLILNSLPNRWRGVYNEDTDLCLQVLADGWCTVLFNAFVIDKIASMVMKGGNTSELYYSDGRLKMARALERMWPGVVETGRRYGRPQHVVKDSWRKFDTPLKLKPGIDLAKIEKNDYGLKLVQVGDEVKSDELRKMLDEQDV